MVIIERRKKEKRFRRLFLAPVLCVRVLRESLRLSPGIAFHDGWCSRRHRRRRPSLNHPRLVEFLPRIIPKTFILPVVPYPLSRIRFVALTDLFRPILSLLHQPPTHHNFLLTYFPVFLHPKNARIYGVWISTTSPSFLFFFSWTSKQASTPLHICLRISRLNTELRSSNPEWETSMEFEITYIYEEF